MKKSFSPEFMAKAALAAIKEESTLAELSGKYEVHRTQIGNWRKRAMAGLADIFRGKRELAKQDQAKLIEELYRQIGRLKVENDWLKKKLQPLSVKEKRGLIEPAHVDLSVRRQCEHIGLHRANLYYAPAPVLQEKLRIMRRIDAIFTELPFYGSRKILEALHREGFRICRERVQKLMREMGLRAIYPKGSLSKPHPEHKIYPYLLNNVAIIRPNQVWSADIAYIRLRQGFLYLAAIMDWFSRYVLAWRLSNSLEAYFCLEALEEALTLGCPEIFNTDQGSQFTSNDFTAKLLDQRIQISMDGRGRVNIFSERLWRSVKYEEVYIKDYRVYADARRGLNNYFDLFTRRPTRCFVE